MTQVKTEPSGIEGVPNQVSLPLPQVARTSSGINFNCSDDVWAYADGLIDVRFNWPEFTHATTNFKNSAKNVLLWYIQNKSAEYARNIFTHLLHFSRSHLTWAESLNEINVVDIHNYGSSLKKANQWYLTTLAVLLKKWGRLGFSGVNPEVGLLLKQSRLKGNQKGFAVLTMDIDEGPFTHLEYEAIQNAINLSYTSGEISSQDYVLTWLYILLGQRNKQHAALKVCDVKTKIKDGRRVYSIMMPRAKQGHPDPRAELKERLLVDQFGEVLVEYADRVKRDFEGILTNPEQAPLFPNKKDRRVPGLQFHRTTEQLRVSFNSVLDSLDVVSERTGKLIYMMPVRFRRTIGTRAAEEGYPPLVIAELLDHSDTQNVMVYAASSPAVLERIARAVAMELAPLAQAFAGKLVDGSEGPKNPSKKIIDLRIDRSGDAMGECGQHSFCGFNAPIACYTCNSFEAWLDGPHEAVLNHLIERREKLLVQSDQRMASINDRTILAVAAVIQKCTDIKSQAQELIHG